MAEVKHRDVMLAPAWVPVRLDPGQRVDRYLGDNAALVEGAEGKQVVESTLPVRARDRSGELAPVSLELADRGDVLAPENPLVRVELARTAAGGFSLPDIGVGVVAVGSAGGSEASVVADKAFHTNVAQDTDLALKPVSQGVETLTQLRSAASPEELAFRFSLPAGATLGPAKDSKFAAEVVNQDGAVLAVVSAPAAWDADQRAVPVTATVSGDTLTLSVRHRDGDWKYPLLVDPTVMENFLYWRWDPSINFTGWIPWKNPAAEQHPNGYNFLLGAESAGYPRGLYIYGGGPPEAYLQNQGAQWYYNPQGDASVTRVAFNYAEIHNNLGGFAGMCHYQGIYSGTQAQWMQTARWIDNQPAVPFVANVHQTCWEWPAGSSPDRA